MDSDEETNQHNFHFSTEFKEDLILHWGLCYKSKEWVAPSEGIFPAETKNFDKKAVQTKFLNDLEHESNLKSIDINLKISKENLVKSLNFVFTIPGKVKNFLIDHFKKFSILI